MNTYNMLKITKYMVEHILHIGLVNILYRILVLNVQVLGRSWLTFYAPSFREYIGLELSVRAWVHACVTFALGEEPLELGS